MLGRGEEDGVPGERAPVPDENMSQNPGGVII